MMEFFVSESILEVGLGGFGFDNRSLPVLNESAQPVIGCNRAARHHEIGRQTDLLDDDQLLVFLLQPEPGSARLHELLELLQRGQQHGCGLGGAGDAGGKRVDDPQPPGARTGIIEDH